MAKRSPSDSILSRITPIADHTLPHVRMLIYGLSKSGKTTLACSYPGKKLLITFEVEDGTRSVSDAENLDILILETATELDQLLDALEEDNVYDCVILDTVDVLRRHHLSEILGSEESAQTTIDNDDYGAATKVTNYHLRRITELECDTIIIAQQRTYNANEEGEGLYPHISCGPTGAISNFLESASDFIIRTYIDEIEVVKKRKNPKTGKERDVTTQVIKHCVLIGFDPIYKTGFRKPRKAYIPRIIVDPTWAKLEKAMKGEWKPQDN